MAKTNDFETQDNWFEKKTTFKIF